MKFYKIIFYFFLLFIFSFNQSYSNITAIEEKFNNLILNNHSFEYPYLENRHDIGIFYDFTYNEKLNKIIIKRDANNFPVVRLNSPYLFEYISLKIILDKSFTHI